MRSASVTRVIAVSAFWLAPSLATAQIDVPGGFWPNTTTAAPTFGPQPDVTSTGFALTAPIGPQAPGGAARAGPSWAGGDTTAWTRFTVGAGGGLTGPNGAPLVVGRYGADDPTRDLISRMVTHDWPSVMRVKTGAFGFDMTPRAGFGWSSAGGVQTAGAMLRFGQGLGAETGDRGGRGRWYLFAATERESLGYSFMRGEEAWKRANIGADPGALVGDTRAGVAWSDGPMEASFGYAQREIRPKDLDAPDVQATKESLLGVRFVYRPR